jgi:manganese oxidase
MFGKDTGRVAVVLAIAALFLAKPGIAQDNPLPRIAAHDNRVAAGVLRDGVLTLQLQIREGEICPERTDGPRMRTEAFAEANKTPSVPGPLVRVSTGTEIRVTVKNLLGHAMEVHGLYTRPGKDTLIALAAGEEREVRFQAGSPGTYYYFGLDPLTTVTRFRMPGGASQFLTGAFIVDERGAKPNDRVFVVSLWRGYTNDTGDYDDEFGTINGRSWPHTERLSFALGESVEWRVINASAAIHPMHLHGAYYRVDAYGNGERDERFTPEKRQMVVTQNMGPGDTMDLNWKPDRPGHWLFHCHIVAHIMPENSLRAIQKLPMEHHGDSGMSGLVLAAEVVGGGKVKKAGYREARHLKLVLSEAVPKQAIRVDVTDGRQTSASKELMGPAVILHRGESSEIEVINRLSEPTAIHWHGMELESYYDGVPDYSGVGKQITPAIAAGGSFVARMTPPRAGTFIYHTHWHDVDQLGSGLYGPLIILEPGAEYHPEQDAVFVAGLTVKDTDGPLLINGSEHAEVTVRGGRVRVRLINITPNNTALRYTLTGNGKKMEWRTLAKDGMDLPPALRKSCEAVQTVGVGETYDFEITASTGDELNLDAYLPGPRIRANAMIHVR